MATWGFLFYRNHEMRFKFCQGCWPFAANLLCPLLVCWSMVIFLCQWPANSITRPSWVIPRPHMGCLHSQSTTTTPQRKSYCDHQITVKIFCHSFLWWNTLIQRSMELTATHHYMKQCWLVTTNKVQWHLLTWEKLQIINCYTTFEVLHNRPCSQRPTDETLSIVSEKLITMTS